ncbi:hypothetical protein WN944_024600 [Citrus x changshan-huyou]|uniref:PGG domain-containing protein n=1 Tax=Citrus x changshan-huyou TaxID=2935761 RepID=A0AAP0LN91_9ROSI
MTAETITRRLKLYRAALNGDWAVAKEIYDKYEDEIGVEITSHGNTALHVAAQANRTDFVKELVKMKKMKAEDLAKRNQIGCTALFYAAASGSVELVKATMEGNKDITMVPQEQDGEDRMLPIVRAASLGHTEVVEFLYRETKNSSEDDDCIELLVQLIETGLYAVALDLLRDHRYLATKRAKNKETALHVLARKNLTSSNQNPRGTSQRYFNLGAKDRKNKEAVKLVESLWEEVILLSERDILKLIEQPRDLILDAANHGNVQFLSILIREYPDLIWKDDENGYTILHIAVSNRLEELFEFIHDIRSIADLMVESYDGEGNNILHLAGKLAPQHRLNVVAGSALQMQRELLWFEAVENVVPKKLAEAKNKDELTPRALFSEKHKELKREGETWMKDTASSCMIVATLIATIVFAAAITVPGGNKEDTGLPFFRQKASFKIFAISNVISLVASSVSIVNFLSIVAPRYAEEDFLYLLPRKLLVGFATLFVAIAAMMVVFSATSYIVFKDGSLWIAILAIVISSMPVILFVKQHFLFFKDVLRSTYASDYLIRKGKTSLFIRKGKTGLFHKAGETKTTKHQWKCKLFNGSNLTIPCTSSCSTNV